MQHHSLSDLEQIVSSFGRNPNPSNLANDPPGSEPRPDLSRLERTATPEVIYAAGKDARQIQTITATFLERNGRAIVSRLPEPGGRALVAQFPGYEAEVHPRAEMVVIREPGYQIRPGGRVGIITAGTSDLPVAEQTRVLAAEMGCEVTLVSDVGVAGLHRLFKPLQALLDANVDVLVVVAGMDGALPSVVTGLVDRPVIGVPTSTGYGVGGQGLAALLSMLQTCAPGLTTLNVDNGVGAGIAAARIANRVAWARLG